MRRLILRSNYLSKEMLNDIENKVAYLHTLFKSKFNLTETSLRNIAVGDNLSQKVLYMNFPYDSYKNIIDEKMKKIIEVDNGNDIQYSFNTKSLRHWIAYHYNDDNTNYILYSKYDNKLNDDFNYIRYRLPKKMGTVTQVNNNDLFYPCIKIVDNEYMMLEYSKKTWVDNEIPYLQYIDNIEEGINNVAKMLYEPVDYEYKAWTTTGHYGIESNDYGLAQKPINSKNFERWNKNFELLKDAINSINNIWNVVSLINWNTENDWKWEDN